MNVPFSQPARVALMIDGDNLSHNHAGALITRAARHGALTVKRVYGNMAKLPGWNDAPGFKCVHAGTGKNASDLLLAVEATALMLTGQTEVLVIASSDRDFSHLAQHLTERGLTVIGVGEAKTPGHFRKSCTSFHDLTPPAPPVKQLVPLDPLVVQTRALIAAEPDGMPVTLLSTRMAKGNFVQISQTPYKTWRAFFSAWPDHFVLDPRDPNARVHLKP